MKKYFLKNYFFQTGLLVLLIITGHYLSLIKPLENVLVLISSPLQSLGFDLGKNMAQKTTSLINKVNWVEENNKLKEKINALEKQLADLKIFIEEQKMIDQQNFYLQSQKINFINGQVIAKTYENNPFIYLINRGEKDGLQVGMAVVNENGALIGKIIKTNPSQAFFLILINTESRVSACLAGQSKISGLVTGMHNISLELTYILKNVNLQTGDLVVTSGQDNNIPAGLIIGEIGAITDEKKDIFKSAEIISPADFKNIKIIAVVLGQK